MRVFQAHDTETPRSYGRACDSVDLQEVSIRYGDVVAVDRLTLHVSPGRVLGMLGATVPGSRRRCAQSVVSTRTARHPDGRRLRHGYA